MVLVKQNFDLSFENSDTFHIKIQKDLDQTKHSTSTFSNIGYFLPRMVKGGFIDQCKDLDLDLERFICSVHCNTRLL